MKKETLADKLAKKSFYSEAFQRSWSVHMQAFKPILEPAFKDDYQSKVHLAAALNLISRQEIQKGFDKLQKLEKACQNDADMTAWLFFMGLCFDLSGMKEEMLAYYQEANEYGHKFYLPYMKVAKKAYEDAVYDVCEPNYRRAIECLEENILAPQYRTFLGAAYSNLASCLVMMRRYEEAEELLADSKKMLPEQRGREAIEIVLRALEGKKEAVEELMTVLEKEVPEIIDETKKVIDKIYSHTHPTFYAVEIESDKIADFWNWFAKEQETLILYIKNEKYDVFFEKVQSQLAKVFPFLEISPEFAVEPKEGFYEILFADFYMKSLENGYDLLIQACPEEVKEKWTFKVVR